MANERKTEDIVRDHFKRDPLFKTIKLEEQRTSLNRARECLSKASKNQTGKPGYPEFIISFPSQPDDIILVECKADIKFHESRDRSNPKDYAVDGIPHYARFLIPEYNVLAIAVSGSEEGQIRISSFYYTKGKDACHQEDEKLLDVYSYINKSRGEVVARRIESEEITKTAIFLNKELNDYSIVEYERCTLISAILLALQNDAFRNSYKEAARTSQSRPSPERVARRVVESIEQVLQDNQIDQGRVRAMTSEYRKIENYAIAKDKKSKKKKAIKEEDNYVLRDIVQELESNILPLMEMGDKGHDVLGRFYNEFIRYAGTDRKTGLVLTPQHIREFFCDIAHLNVNDVVFDSCCGTGGFLLAAMKRMLELAGNDEQKKRQIKAEQLVGIEKRPDMFTYACSNMMMGGDGKSHIYQGDSFSGDEKARLKGFKPTVSFLNPPYDVGPEGQLRFIQNALECLAVGGRCVAIVQMSCATESTSKVTSIREELLRDHNLSGAFSMPNDLFHPVGVVTCIMVFEARIPHRQGYKTFFGYFKDDGFEKTKNMGRIDKGSWDEIKNAWLGHFLNRESKAGVSVLQSIEAEDEWCAEAYMETDYSKLDSEDFEKAIREYVSFRVRYD